MYNYNGHCQDVSYVYSLCVFSATSISLFPTELIGRMRFWKFIRLELKHYYWTGYSEVQSSNTQLNIL